MRQLVQACGNVLRARPCLGGEPLDFARIGDRPLFEIDRQQRQPLTDVVVQLARDPRPLGFLRLASVATRGGGFARGSCAARPGFRAAPFPLVVVVAR